MAIRTRQRLGPRFREGTRLLWAAIERADLSIADAAKRLGWLRSTLSNVLYGERLPGIESLVAVERVFGVPVATWAEEPTVPFIPPAARLATPPDNAA